MSLQFVNTSTSWTANELKKHPGWIYSLSKFELEEINDAIFNSSDYGLEKINKTTFSIPSLSKRIYENFFPQLECGIGTLLIRGINIDNYTYDECEKLFYGIGAYFGVALPQSTNGETLHRVEDLGFHRDDDKARGTNTKSDICFHNDPCDVASLFCIRSAKQGGLSKLVNSIAIHNKMLRDCPDLLEELYQPFYTLRHRANTTMKQPFTARPIFSFEENTFVCNVLRRYISLAQDHPDIPKMTNKQHKALAVFDELADSDELCHKFYLQPGDLWFVNNYTTLHSREAYFDDTHAENKRLLLRLWLSVANSRPLPESYRPIYRNIEPGSLRGGYMPTDN